MTSIGVRLFYIGVMIIVAITILDASKFINKLNTTGITNNDIGNLASSVVLSLLMITSVFYLRHHMNKKKRDNIGDDNK